MSASKMNSLNTNQNETNALAKQYQKKTDRQHILDNPDTYNGSVENVDSYSVYINDDFYGNDITEIQINTGDIIKIDIVKDDNTKSSKIVLQQQLI